MARPFLIDTDAGSDDAVAILMALRHTDVDVRAITVVAGNVPLPQGVLNSLYFTELCQTLMCRFMPAPIDRCCANMSPPIGSTALMAWAIGATATSPSALGGARERMLSTPSSRPPAPPPTWSL